MKRQQRVVAHSRPGLWQEPTHSHAMKRDLNSSPSLSKDIIHSRWNRRKWYEACHSTSSLSRFESLRLPKLHPRCLNKKVRSQLLLRKKQYSELAWSRNHTRLKTIMAKMLMMKMETASPKTIFKVTKETATIALAPRRTSLSRTWVCFSQSKWTKQMGRKQVKARKVSAHSNGKYSRLCCRKTCLRAWTSIWNRLIWKMLAAYLNLLKSKRAVWC